MFRCFSDLKSSMTWGNLKKKEHLLGNVPPKCIIFHIFLNWAAPYKTTEGAWRQKTFSLSGEEYIKHEGLKLMCLINIVIVSGGNWIKPCGLEEKLRLKSLVLKACLSRYSIYHYMTWSDARIFTCKSIIRTLALSFSIRSASVWGNMQTPSWRVSCLARFLLCNVQDGD